jgi:hypothetical protein
MGIMTPEELAEEERELEENKSVFPHFLVEEFRKGREERRIRAQTGKRVPYNPTKITDFLPLITNIWVISNKDYQERFWVRQELPMRGDSFDETTMTFEEDSEGILEEIDPPIEMTDKQRKMLTKLFHLVEDYCGEVDTPFKTHGRIDREIVPGEKWDKIRQYAKVVYEELSGDDLDAWEKHRANGE